MPSDDDVVNALKMAISAQRGYADFDSWPDRPTKEFGIGSDFAEAAAGLVEVKTLEPVPSGQDPPDLIANGNIGIEVTEFVDPAMVAAANQQIHARQLPTQYRSWSEDEFLARLNEIVMRKDGGTPKLARTWAGYWLLVHTDEPGLTPDMLGLYKTRWVPPECRLITRCLLMMSYFPNLGRPIFEFGVNNMAPGQ